MKDHLKGFVKSYLHTALWASSDYLPGTEEDIELDNYDGEMSLSALKQAVKDCKAFIELVTQNFDAEKAEEILYREAQDLEYLAPHDFWLTRNGHGAGFWDGDWKTEDPENKLTALSKQMGSCDLYIGDDGKIYAY
jgi:hypothetical protein